jgi:hypothetical protein
MCDLLSYLWPVDSASPLIKWLYVVYYAASVATVFYTYEQYLMRAYRTHWFDVSREGWLKKLSWNPDVKYLMTEDPLEHTPRWRMGFPVPAPRDFLVMVLALGGLVRWPAWPRGSRQESFQGQY